jgi:hypothetical protein
MDGVVQDSIEALQIEFTDVFVSEVYKNSMHDALDWV